MLGLQAYPATLLLLGGFGLYLMIRITFVVIYNLYFHPQNPGSQDRRSNVSLPELLQSSRWKSFLHSDQEAP
jgi:hypothetical protein